MTRLDAQTLARHAADLSNFGGLQDYLDFCTRFLEFVDGGGFRRRFSRRTSTTISSFSTRTTATATSLVRCVSR